MRTLNHLILILSAIVVATAFTACRHKNKSGDDEQPHVIRSNDELRLQTQDTIAASQQLKNSLNDIANEVNEVLDETIILEQTINSTDISQLTPSKRAKLRNEVLVKKNAIHEKRKRLEEIETAIGTLDEQSKTEMMLAVNDLRQQLDMQKSRIEQLSAKLHSSTPHINDKIEKTDSTEVNNQPVEVTQKTVEDDINQKEQREVLNNELNECYFAIGTKEELKSHKIIDSEFLKKTKVMQSGNLLISYFTKATSKTRISGL